MSLDLYKNTIQGRVAIGERHKEKGYPVKLDYFIFTHPFDQKTKIAAPFPEMSQIMEAKYKTKKPKEIEIILVDDHPDEAFFTNYLNYPGTTCNCHGNGVTATRKDKEGNKTQVECNYATCCFRMTKTNKGEINTCKPTGILTFLIPEAPIAGGLWKFVTHSEMSIGKLAGSLRNIYAIRGTLKGLRVNIKVVIVQINIKGQVQNVPTIEINLPFSWEQLKLGAGTAIGTLDTMKQNHLSMGSKPDPVKMKELSTSAEALGYDGSNDNTVLEGEIVTDAQAKPEVKSAEPPLEDQKLDDGEFHF